jgi:hypothetical protein
MPKDFILRPSSEGLYFFYPSYFRYYIITKLATICEIKSIFEEHSDRCEVSVLFIIAQCIRFSFAKIQTNFYTSAKVEGYFCN